MLPLRFQSTSMRSCAALVSLTLVAGAVGAELPSARTAWIKAETPHFTALSDAPKRVLRDALENLEQLHAILSQLSPGHAGGSFPCTVYVFRNRATFDLYSPFGTARRDVSGYFVPGELRSHLVIDAGGSEDEGLSSVIHEYLHRYAATHFPEIPLWFNEGLAEYYSTFTLHGDQAWVGRTVPEHLDWLRSHSLMPVSELFAVTHESPLYNEAQHASIFYAQSWATVHYLLSDPLRREATGRFLALVGNGVEAATAFERAFGRPLGALDDELRSYVRSRRFTFLKVPVASAIPDVEIARIHRSEALAELTTLLLDTPPLREKLIREGIEAALAEDPRQPLALVSLGRLEAELGADQQATWDVVMPLLRRGCEHDRAGWACLAAGAAGLHALFGVARLGQSSEAQEEALLAIRGALNKAFELDPSLVLSQVLLGQTYVVGGDPQEGLNALRLAQRLMPGRAEVYLGMALVLARAARFEQAWQTADRLQEYEATKPVLLARPELVRTTRLGVAQLQLLQSSVELREGHSDAALELVQGVRERAARYDLSATLSTAIEEIERVATYNLSVDLLNDAVSAYNAGRLEQALEILDRLIADERTDAGLRTTVRELRGRILERRRASGA